MGKKMTHHGACTLLTMHEKDCSTVDTILITVLVALLLVTLGYLLFTVFSQKRLTFEKYAEDTRDPGDHVLYFFLMNGCGWCDQLKPHVEKITNLQQVDAEFAKLVSVRTIVFPTSDGDEQQLAKDFGVQAFPTIVLSRENKTKYWVFSSPERTAERIQDWVTSVVLYGKV
jgi:thioredoxin-related protein